MTWSWATSSSSAPERKFPSTAESSPVSATSTRHPSPANRYRPRSRRATRSSPGRSTGGARSTSRSHGYAATARSRGSFISSSGRRPSARRRRRSSIASRAFTRRSSSSVAVVVALVPPLLTGGLWSDWIYRALVLLVISCPCALVISTPVSIVSALAAAARKGVLIKGGARLERLAAVRCVAFDKTGTLTKGQLRVESIAPLDGIAPSEILALAASLELHSEHPIGRAILRRAEETGVTAAAPDGFQALPGLGAEGRVGGTDVIVGSHRLFEERGMCSIAGRTGARQARRQRRRDRHGRGGRTHGRHHRSRRRTSRSGARRDRNVALARD